MTQYLSFKVSKCDSSAQKADCASEEDLKEYLSNHRLGIITSFNYIDYDEVEPFEGPIKHTTQWVDLLELEFS